MSSIDLRVEDLLSHYEKHLADTRRENTAHEFARYALEYCNRCGNLPKPKYPPEPKPSPGLMIYQQGNLERRKKVGWSHD